MLESEALSDCRDGHGTWLTWTDGRAAGTGGKRRARTDDVRRPAAGAGEGRRGGTMRGLRQAPKPQSSLARLWLVTLNLV